MDSVTLEELESRARSRVAAVADDPMGRYQLRVDFYEKYGCQDLKGSDGYGNSELAFFKWEIDRGVLNPLDHNSAPGSPWWRKVNGEFVYHGVMGQLAYEHGVPGEQLPKPVSVWIDYIENPSPKTWYRAHNTSIVSAYLKYIEEAHNEREAEQTFLNEVLYRVLYAQAMVEDATIFGEIGALAANPCLFSVSVLVHMPNFYPSHYPLEPHDVQCIQHKGISIEQFLVDTLDEKLILPHLYDLYEKAAGWLGIEELGGLQHQGKPIYPNRS